MLYEVITAISRYTPWKSLCMVQALTAQTILSIKRIPCTIYLGIAKDDQQKLQAHAWLMCGDFVVTGGDVRDEFV